MRCERRHRPWVSSLSIVQINWRPILDDNALACIDHRVYRSRTCVQVVELTIGSGDDDDDGDGGGCQVGLSGWRPQIFSSKTSRWTTQCSGRECGRACVCVCVCVCNTPGVCVFLILTISYTDLINVARDCWAICGKFVGRPFLHLHDKWERHTLTKEEKEKKLNKFCFLKSGQSSIGQALW